MFGAYVIRKSDIWQGHQPGSKAGPTAMSNPVLIGQVNRQAVWGWLRDYV